MWYILISDYKGTDLSARMRRLYTYVIYNFDIQGSCRRRFTLVFYYQIYGVGTLSKLFLTPYFVWNTKNTSIYKK